MQGKMVHTAPVRYDAATVTKCGIETRPHKETNSEAELAQRGVITSDAEAHYENGVKAEMEQWEVVPTVDYFDNPNAAYYGSLERILLKKYVALYFNDYQQWFEYRRTGFPVLPKADGMLNEQRVPVRFRYPVNAQLNNPVSYQEAVAGMGGDNINTKVWWEE